MANLCGDNRFELINKYKKELIEATNIESSKEEMDVLDSILFRFWQMGWLDSDNEKVTHCKDCRFFRPRSLYGLGICDVHCNGVGKSEFVRETGFCADAERKEE